MKNALFFLFALLLTLAAPIWAQSPKPSPAALFPVVLPWDDATSSTITDVSFLNAKPAGVHGFVVARSGHFVETLTGHRLRFLGVNFAAHAAFPSHADAEKVAARLAKFGINIVRLHHMDNSDWGQDASIWDYGYSDRQHLSAVQLDRLDYLVAQLKQNGIYVNLNLHVSRRFTEADGFPASVRQIPTSYDKRVDEFDPRMIQLQKSYARALLTHVNPYTHLSYASDPAVAVVEITNEDSLVGDPWATPGAGLDTLPEPFRGELVGLWNAWLLRKYGTDSKLQPAWAAGLTPLGPGLLSPASPWSIEQQGASHAALKPIAGGADAEITQTDGTDWHVQMHQTALTLQGGATYTVTFRAKADTVRTIPLAATLDQADWHNVGLSADAALTAAWKPFRFVFTAHDTVPGHVRLTFLLGGQIGTVTILDLQIHPGIDAAGLPPGQSLTSKSVDIPAAATPVQHADWITFLADTERGYAEEMRSFLKDTLKVHANIICSQISWGGLTGLSREAGSDFADNHAYWQHPSFPHKQWDPNDWTIANTPMVADLADGKGGTLLGLAENRVAGKPYSVSEYNHPAPNDYRAETLPELATFAAFQDWDAIYLFDYGDYGTGASNDRINGFFNIGSDPAKTAFLPAAAMIFRASELPMAITSHILLVPPLQALSIQNASDARKAFQKGQEESPFFYLMAIQNSPAHLAENGIGMLIADGWQIDTKDTLDFPDCLQVTQSRSGAQYIATSASADCAAGYVGGTTVEIDALQFHAKSQQRNAIVEATFTFLPFGNNFAAVTLTAMDQKPTAQSKRLLLTLVGKVENQNMGWNADRTSVGSNWGQGPTVAEGIPAAVTLKTDGPRTVWALDGAGRHAVQVPTSYANGTLTFTVGPQFKTLWYEVGK